MASISVLCDLNHIVYTIGLLHCSSMEDLCMLCLAILNLAGLTQRASVHGITRDRMALQAFPVD